MRGHFYLGEQEKDEAAADPAGQQIEALARLIAGVLSDPGLDAAAKKKKVIALIDHVEPLPGAPGNGNGGPADGPPLQEQTGATARRYVHFALTEQSREREMVAKMTSPPRDPRLRKIWMHS